MPKRSNEFQRLVAMLTHLSSGDAVVRESVELMEIVSGDAREVDVVALGEVAGHGTAVGIECRDWKRKQDVQWVEQADNKFKDLGANVKVLVSSSGFTKAALEKATRYGIKTITPGGVTPEFVGKVVNSAEQIQYHHWVNLPLKAEVVVTRDGVTQQQELPGNVPVLLADGLQASLFEDLVNHVMKDHTRTHDDEWNEVFRAGEETYGKGKVRYVATGDGPQPLFDGQKVYLEGISNETGERELYEIANVIVEFQTERTIADVSLRHGDYDGTYFSTGTAALGEGNELQLVYTETADGEFEMMGRIDGTIESLGPLLGSNLHKAATQQSNPSGSAG
jgi:hypothetical protein